MYYDVKNGYLYLFKNMNDTIPDKSVRLMGRTVMDKTRALSICDEYEYVYAANVQG